MQIHAQATSFLKVLAPLCMSANLSSSIFRKLGGRDNLADEPLGSLASAETLYR